MNKMKLLVCAIFSLILAIGLTACGSEEEETTQEIEPVPEESIMGEEGTTGMEQPTETEGTTEMGEPTGTEGTTGMEQPTETEGTTGMGEPTETEGTTEGATVEERVEEETEQP